MVKITNNKKSVVALLVLCLWGGEAALAQDRILPRPVHPPASFAGAISYGSRTTDGTPGAAYWQQHVDYQISATLDVEAGALSGRETIRYRNNSPDVLGRVVLHLDQNVFAPGARRNRRAPITGGIKLNSVRVDGVNAETAHPGNSYYEALTLLVVQLPDSLRPNASASIDIDWEYTVPPSPTFRNGNMNGEIFAIGQWYPRVAVYDDVYGWDESPYLGDGEFYLEYGDFDVALTVPAGWVIGATGVLANADEVLTPEAVERLRRAHRSENTVQVIGEQQRGAGNGTLGSEGETLTWRFRADDVRDFAWSTSARYVWDAASVNDSVLAQAFYRPQLDAWQRGVEYVAHTVRTMSAYLGDYAYPQLSITEGPVGGMEYPMLIFNPGTNNPRGLAGVTIHEGAHQWFPMMVGSMEAKHTWMDEGLVSYWDVLSSAELNGTAPLPWGENRFYLAFAGSEQEVPLMRRTDLVNPYGARTLAAYTKPAVVMGALRAVLGDELFETAFREYFQNWKFRHPQPWDFFNTFERVAGRDLDWFWRPLFFEIDVLDQAVDNVWFADGSTTIRIVDNGDVILPAIVEIQLASGESLSRTVPVEVWLGGSRSYEISVEGRVTSVIIDSASAFPDTNRANNSWTAPR